MRASDADRDRYATVLREALASGRLTAEEHDERITAVLHAKTIGELVPLVRDLPEAGELRGKAPVTAPVSRAAAGARPSAKLVAIFGAADRSGDWTVPDRIDGLAMFGGIELDFTRAEFRSREVSVNLAVLFGGVEITVPEDVTVRCHGAGIFGAFQGKEQVAAAPDAPVLNITGFALFGGVEVKRRKRKKLTA